MTQQRTVLLKEFSADAVGDLVEAYDDWRLSEDTERTFLDFRYEVDGGTHYLLILYTE